MFNNQPFQEANLTRGTGTPDRNLIINITVGVGTGAAFMTNASSGRGGVRAWGE